MGDRDPACSVTASCTATPSGAVPAETGFDGCAVTRVSWGGAVTDRLAWKPVGMASFELLLASSCSRTMSSSTETASPTVPAAALESPSCLSSDDSGRSKLGTCASPSDDTLSSSRTSTAFLARGLAGTSSLGLCRGVISAGVTGVGGNTADDLRDIGVHGRFLTGVCGRSGSSTVKPLLKGHSVFSNWRIWLSTSLSSKARRVSS